MGDDVEPRETRRLTQCDRSFKTHYSSPGMVAKPPPYMEKMSIELPQKATRGTEDGLADTASAANGSDI